MGQHADKQTSTFDSSSVTRIPSVDTVNIIFFLPVAVGGWK
jgi:hypothetical protein